MQNLTDTKLRNDVADELRYDPRVKETDIGIITHEGVVTLTGSVRTFAEKWAAVQAAKKVKGVRALADEIEVQLGSAAHSDGDIAAAAVHHLDWSTVIPKGTVKVKVTKGWVTLEGDVEWRYQRTSAENAVRYLTGVKGVTNLIEIKPKLHPADIRKSIEAAFERNALLDAHQVHVEAVGNKATLKGKVRSYAERETAEKVAWAAQGVWNVDNQLRVELF